MLLKYNNIQLNIMLLFVRSLIPLLTDVAGRGVQASSKLGHGELSETTRKQYGKCKTGS